MKLIVLLIRKWLIFPVHRWSTKRSQRTIHMRHIFQEQHFSPNSTAQKIPRGVWQREMRNQSATRCQLLQLIQLSFIKQKVIFYVIHNVIIGVTFAVCKLGLKRKDNEMIHFWLNFCKKKINLKARKCILSHTNNETTIKKKENNTRDYILRWFFFCIRNSVFPGSPIHIRFNFYTCYMGW